ncbi:hypothetical protein JO972_03460 [Verrucomicrobiaceae bacterium 5K15]|uniref:Uncharacterized protein n=1 Tax=Oceaniferula flava TaxID=2800421 RepID=A0AAE2SAF1_9BACT|nr:hypothetical protein [Oceaniferula flavus]MBK1853999.1 hypothetical protein [Oceaniferula flavus]MBM1135305.1 hypothetical protein [Oceaniferula flavus]
MKSPVGSHQELVQTELDEGLIAFRCPESGGHWIPVENYWQWLPLSTQEGKSDTPAAQTDAPLSEFNDAVKLCPATGTIMTRYRVGHGLDFRIDRSITGGIWLDGGEWEALQAGNLHNELHLVFTAPWQQAVRNAEHAAQYDAMLREKLGDDLYQRLSDIRDELVDHPAKAEAVAYLQHTSTDH